MMNAEEAIAYIRTYSGEAGRPGLSRIRELLHRMGNPQNRLRFVHVAGGSGRGPACAALESVFRSAGYTTGLLLASSDSVRLSGRIRTDGCPIPDGDLAHVTEETAVLADAMEEHPTESELSTALAIQYFAEQGCEIVLLEAGMGGETDSTNVIDRPDAVLIMDVGPERTEDPEKSRMETAEANAAVIKQGCTAVCYPVSPEANRLFRGRCAALYAGYAEADLSALEPAERETEGQPFLWRGREIVIPDDLRPGDAAVVLTAAETLRGLGWELPAAAVREGLRTVHRSAQSPEPAGETPEENGGAPEENGGVPEENGETSGENIETPEENGGAPEANGGETEENGDATEENGRAAEKGRKDFRA